MRISACLIVNLVRVHVKEGKPKSENVILSQTVAPSRVSKLFVSLSPANTAHQLQHHFAT